MNDDLTKILDDCLKMLDENIDILSTIEFDLDDEREDQLKGDMHMHELYDMTDDVALSAKIKRAEINFMKRQYENT